MRYLKEHCGENHYHLCSLLRMANGTGKFWDLSSDTWDLVRLGSNIFPDMVRFRDSKSQVRWIRVMENVVWLGSM